MGLSYLFSIALASFFISSFVDGFVAKGVASVWRYRGYIGIEKETLEEVASKHKCPECGHPVLGQNFKFCPSFGELISAESEV